MLIAKAKNNNVSAFQRFLGYYHKNPYATSTEIALDLGYAPSYVRVLKYRLKRKFNCNLDKICPNCLNPSLVQDQNSKVCTNCGYEVAKPVERTIPDDLIWNRGPELNLQEGDNLGNRFDFNELHKYKIVKTLACERYLSAKEPLQRLQNECKSQLQNYLKEIMLPMDKTNEITKLMLSILRKEYSHYKQAERMIKQYKKRLVAIVVSKTLEEASKYYPRLKTALEKYQTLAKEE
jgi:hypothetical protein